MGDGPRHALNRLNLFQQHGKFVQRSMLRPDNDTQL